MSISQESADAIKLNIKILESQKSDILSKVNETQDEIDNLTKRLSQIQSQADEIDASIGRMKQDLSDGGVKI